MALDVLDIKYFKYAVGTNIGKETPNDIASRCIICGDGKDKKKKRLHLYTKVGYDHDVIKCFNCEFTGNMFTFLKTASPHLYEQYKNEKRSASFEWLKAQHKTTQKEPEFNDAEIWFGDKPKPKEISVPEPEPEVELNADPRKMPDNVFYLPEEFIPASASPEATEYLDGRRISTEGIYYSEEWIKFNGKKMPLKNSIIIPLWVNEDKKICYGFQARNISTKFFYTYIPEENSGWKVWNWFNIDPSKKIFIFESVFDAMSSGLPRDQMVGALGADLNDDRINEVQDVIFCLDNQFQDVTSKVKSQELLKKGFKVFIWDTTIPEKDANKWLQNHVELNPVDFAKIILTNIYEGTKGILKIKLRR